MLIMKDDKVEKFVSTKVLSVHQRNGGMMKQLDINLPLRDETLLLDSLDIAEIVAEIEREYRVNLFEDDANIICWNHIVDIILSNQHKQDKI